jgi:stage III sporulation protein AG
VLLVASEWTGGEKQTQKRQDAIDPQAYAAELETRLGTLIRHIRGAGETRVLVTLRADGETVWARNDELESESGESGRLRSSQAYVLLRDGSAESGLRLRTGMPTVQGVAVVCAGADDPQVCARITSTVTAALGIGASHVSVVQMQ